MLSLLNCKLDDHVENDVFFVNDLEDKKPKLDPVTTTKELLLGNAFIIVSKSGMTGIPKWDP